MKPVEFARDLKNRMVAKLPGSKRNEPFNAIEPVGIKAANPEQQAIVDEYNQLLAGMVGAKFPRLGGNSCNVQLDDKGNKLVNGISLSHSNSMRAVDSGFNVGRAAVGAMLLGPIGLMLGANGTRYEYDPNNSSHNSRSHTATLSPGGDIEIRDESSYGGRSKGQAYHHSNEKTVRFTREADGSLTKTVRSQESGGHGTGLEGYYSSENEMATISLHPDGSSVARQTSERDSRGDREQIQNLVYTRSDGSAIAIFDTDADRMGYRETHSQAIFKAADGSDVKGFIADTTATATSASDVSVRTLIDGAVVGPGQVYFNVQPLPVAGDEAARGLRESYNRYLDEINGEPLGESEQDRRSYRESKRVYVQDGVKRCQTSEDMSGRRESRTLSLDKDGNITVTSNQDDYSRESSTIDFKRHADGSLEVVSEYSDNSRDYGYDDRERGPQRRHQLVSADGHTTDLNAAAT